MSIIGAKESGEKTRLYELAKIYGVFRGRGNGKANYLIQLYNEKHEEKTVDVYEGLERDIEKMVREIVVNENAKILKENQEKMEALFRANSIRLNSIWRNRLKNKIFFGFFKFNKINFSNGQKQKFRKRKRIY